MNTGRDNHLWLKLWRNRDIAFHQESTNGLLTRFWPKVGHTLGSRIFVPLCGKSLDILWLAQRGYEVIGVELSPIAVKAFFRENRLQPKRRRIGQFTVWTHGNIRILCGDYFLLSKADLGHVDTVYDRAALTALPEDIRGLYVAHLRCIVPASANIFLLTVEDGAGAVPARPSAEIDQEVQALYSDHFEIVLAHTESTHEADATSSTKAGLAVDYKVYRLTAKTGR